MSSVLALARLDGRLLWEDEAETALLARRILEVGLPIARDGQNVISQGCGHDADENYLWTFHPWLPMYLVAASFKLFGVSTLAARLPFALLGVLAVVSLYAVGRRMFRDPTPALIAAASLGLSVPFLLHVRQARYYAIAALAAVWMLGCLRPAAAGGRLATLGLIAASTVMLHANHAMFAATFVALLTTFGVFHRDGRGLLRLAAAGALTLLVNAPWLAIYGGAWVGAAFAAEDRTAGAALRAFATGILWSLEHVDLYALPATLVLVFAAWAAVEGWRTVRGSTELRDAAELLVFSLVYLVAVSPLPYRSTRFMLNVFPALVLVQTSLVWTLGRRRPLLAAGLFAVLTFSTVLHGWVERLTGKAPPPRPPTLVNYVRELTHDFDGPMRAIVDHLRAHARPGETVFISYGDLPLRFYTDLDVRGGVTCEAPPALPPRWIVARHFFRFVHPAPGTAVDLERMRRYLRDEVPWFRYERIDLPVVDTVWENNPEPRWHLYVTPAAGPPIVIHRLREPTR